MKTIRFSCANCENVRKVIVTESNASYIIGNCDVCKSTITINRLKTKYS